MRGLLRSLGMMIVLLAILIGIVCAIARRVPPIIAESLAPIGCAQPCWHGVRPGLTRVAEARAILQTDPLIAKVIRNDPNVAYPCELEWTTLGNEYTGCMIIAPDRPVSQIILRYGVSDLRLSDAIGWFGLPIRAELCRRYDFGPTYSRAVFATVYFTGDVAVAVYAPSDAEQRFDPMMRLKVIWYEEPGLADFARDTTPLWDGFRAVYYALRGCGVRR